MSQHSHHGAHGGTEPDKLPEGFKVQTDLNRPGHHESHQKNYSAVATAQHVPHGEDTHLQMEIDDPPHQEDLLERFNVQLYIMIQNNTENTKQVSMKCSSKLHKQLQFMCEHESLQKAAREKLSKLGAASVTFSPEKDIKIEVVNEHAFLSVGEARKWWAVVKGAMEEVVKEVLVVVINLNNEEMFKRISSESLVQKKEVNLSFHHGIWICGMPEAVLCFLQQTTLYHNMNCLYDPETNVEVTVCVVPLSKAQNRLLDKFKVLDEIRYKEQDMKLLLDEERMLLLLYGEKQKVQRIVKCLAEEVWCKDLKRMERTISTEELCFLRQREIEQYIDQKLLTKMASWITKKNHNDGVLLIFAVRNEDLDLTIRIIGESCQKKELNVKYQDEIKDWISSLNIKFPGKIMVIPEKSVVRFYATDDIFKELCMEIATFEKKIAVCTGEVGHQAREDHRTEKKSAKHVVIPLSAGESKFIVKEECMNIIREIADNNEVKFEFTPDMEIVLRGMQEGVDSVKKYIEDNLLQSLETYETSIKEPLMVWTLKEDGYKVFEDIEKQFECDINTQCSEWKIGSVLIVVQQGNIKETVDVIVKTGDRKEGSWIGNLKEYCIPIQSESKGKASTDLAKNFEDMFQEVCGNRFQTVSIQMCHFKEMRIKTVVKAVVMSLRELKFPRNAMLKKVFLHDSSPSIYKRVKKCLDETSGFPSILEDLPKDGTCKLEVYIGQLTEEKVDVIVNTTSQKLILSEGKVSGTILKAAGSAIQDQITRDYPDGVKNGMVAVTKGHRLNCHKVYHGALKKWGSTTAERNHSKKVLQTFISNCLHEMDREKLSSVAFPVLGSGILKIPVDVFTNVLVDVVESHEELHPQTSVKNIRVIVYGGPGGVEGQFEKIKDIILKKRNAKMTSKLGEQHTSCIDGNHITVKQVDQTKGKTGEYDARIYLWNSQTLYDSLAKSRFYEQTDCCFHHDMLRIMNGGHAAILKETYFPLLINVLVKDENYEEALERAVQVTANERSCTNAYIGFEKSDFYGKDCQKFTKAVSKTFRLMTGWKENISELTIGVEKAFMNNMIQALSADDLSGQTDRKIGPLEIIKSTVHLEITAEKEKVHSIHDALMHMLHDRKDRLLLERNDAQAANEKPEISPKTHSDSNLVKEPGVQEISRDAQNGNQEEDQENDVWVPPTSQSKPVTVHNDQQNKEILPQQTTEIPEKEKSGIHLVLTEDEKRCVILTATNNTLEKDEILKTLEGHSVSLVVFPFLSSNDGLIKCASAKDADLLIGKKFAKFSLSSFPPQAANDIKAVLTPRVMEILKNVPDIVSQVENKTGAHLCLGEKTLRGNLLEIQVAEKFIKKFINYQISEKSERMSHPLKNENTRYEKETEHVEIPKQSLQGNQQLLNKTTTEMRKETLVCTELDCTLLRHFFNDLPLSSTHPQTDKDGNVKFSGKSGSINEIRSALQMLHAFPQQRIREVHPRQYEKIRNMAFEKRESFHLIYEENSKEICIRAKGIDILWTVESGIKNALAEMNESFQQNPRQNQETSNVKEYSGSSDINDQKLHNVQERGVSQWQQSNKAGVVDDYDDHQNTLNGSPGIQNKRSGNAKIDKLDTQTESKAMSSYKTQRDIHHRILYFRKDLDELKVDYCRTDGDNEVIIHGSRNQITCYKKAEKEVCHYPSTTTQFLPRDIDVVTRFMTSNDSPDVYMALIKTSSGREPDLLQIVCKDTDTLERLFSTIEKLLGFASQNEKSVKAKGKGESVNFGKPSGSRGKSGKVPNSNTSSQKPVKPPSGSLIYCEKDFKLYVYNGDLFNLNVDGIINPSNKSLDLKYGISKYIMKEAGLHVKDECSRIVQYRSLKIGDTVHTNAGSMNHHYSYIIHTCTPNWKDYECSADGMENCKKHLGVTLSNCLYKADELKLKAIGCTLIGAGQVGGIPLQLAVMCFKSATQKFFKHNPKSNLREVHIVDTSDSFVGTVRKIAKHPNPLMYRRVDRIWEVHLPCDLLIRVYCNNFINVQSDILVVNEDEHFTGERFMVNRILQMKCEKYREAHSELKSKKHSVTSVVFTDAPTNSNFKKVLHVVMPWKTSQETQYKKCIEKVFSEVCKYNQSCTNVLLPLLGAGHLQEWKEFCAGSYVEQILKFDETYQSKENCYVTCIDIVNDVEHTDLMKKALEKKFKTIEDKRKISLIFTQVESKV